MLLIGESHTVMFILLTHVCIAYHNSFKLFIGISKYESTSILFTLFGVQCSQRVIRNIVYTFMCRRDSSVNCIINYIIYLLA